MMWTVKYPENGVDVARTAMPLLIAAALTLATGCDSVTSRVSGPDDGEAVVMGQIASTPGTANAALATATADEDAAVATTVVIGDVSLSGSFQALRQADVDAGGNFRIERVPAGRTNLIVSARSASGVELGSVVLLEETRSDAEHRTQPIDAGSTLHARVWSEIKSSGSSSAPWIGPAELALFIHADADVAAGAAASSAAIRAIADAALAAETALSASLGAQGVDATAEARNALVAEAAIARDQSRAAGGNIENTQRAFVQAALAAWASGGIDAEAAATATATAATGLDRAMAQASADARLDLAREAVLLNLAARSRVAAQQQGNPLGLRVAVESTLGSAKTGIGAATTMAQLRGALADSRVGVEGSVVAAVSGNLPDLPIELAAAIEGELRTALGETRLWARLDGTTTASGMADASAEFRGKALDHALQIIDALPANARAGISAEAIAAILIAFGAGAQIS
jgi:hypothetical protein